MSDLFADRERTKKRHMDDSVKDRLASEVLELLIDFEIGLSDRKRKYPAQAFFAFASAARRYIDLTQKDQLVRRDVAVALKDLAACLEVRRKGVPEAVVLEAHRLESLFFDGYDPYFEGVRTPWFVECTEQSVSILALRGTLELDAPQKTGASNSLINFRY